VAKCVVDDSEFLIAEQILGVYAENLNEAGLEFQKLCQFVLDRALMQSVIRGSILNLDTQMGGVCRALTDVSEKMLGKSDDFIQGIIEIDQFEF
jgi:hypothetical protein